MLVKKNICYTVSYIIHRAVTHGCSWTFVRLVSTKLLALLLPSSISGKAGTVLFQNQCFLHRRIISSIGIPFVSGSKTHTKIVMTVIHPAKKRKIPNLNAQRRERKDCPIMNVKRRFTATVMLCPADRVSSGNISLGTVHPSGPHDHPKATTNKQITTTTSIEKLFVSSWLFPNFSPRIKATTHYCTK